jgi:hypothetical protein
MIPESEFRNIFEAMWHDRAQAAGWTLLLKHDGDDWVFRFQR